MLVYLAGRMPIPERARGSAGWQASDRPRGAGRLRNRVRGAIRCAVAASSSAVWMACGSGPEPTSDVHPPPQLTVLISIDTLRADHLGVYGYPRPTSPRIDKFAEQAVVFDDATSTAPWTLPAHASLFSGLYPEHHRLTTFERRLPMGVDTIAARLARSGFDTRAVVNTHLLSNRFGLEHGFAKLKYIEEALVRVSPSTWVTDQAMEWISEPRDRPMFLFVHYYDVHSDYAALPEFREPFERPYDGEIDGSTLDLKEFRYGLRSIDARDVDHLIDLYDAGLRQTDEELERLFAFLRERGELDTSLIVLVSDHGEEFLEHGSVLHGQNQHAEVLRVPLIIRYPPLLKPMRIASPVSLVDVVPTVLALLGQPPMKGLDGKDLSPLWNEPSDETIATFEQRALFTGADHSPTQLPDESKMFNITRSIRKGHFKLIYDTNTGARELFDLRTDPGEKVDVADLHADVVEQLTSLLLESGTGSMPEGTAIELTDDEKKLVEALGYGVQ